MRLNTFFQICIYITVTLILFTLAINYVSTLGVFSGYQAEAGMQTGATTNETLAHFATSPDYPKGFVMDNLWAVVLMGTVGALAVAFITRSPIIIGVYIFAFVFWSSYTNVISLFAANDFLTDIWGLIAIGTVGIGFIFVGAVAGMLSGSG